MKHRSSGSKREGKTKCPSLAMAKVWVYNHIAAAMDCTDVLKKSEFRQWAERIGLNGKARKAVNDLVSRHKIQRVGDIGYAVSQSKQAPA